MFVLATVKGGLHHVGSYVKILDADDSSHEVEVFTKEILADREPPGGTAHTSLRDFGGFSPLTTV
jgi:hypothetical protein